MAEKNTDTEQEGLFLSRVDGMIFNLQKDPSKSKERSAT